MKPIIFSTPMVQAILEGRKTQTRRIIKPQPENYNEKSFIDRCNFKNGNWCFKHRVGSNPDRFEITDIFKSKYQTGDILWVRETFVEGVEMIDSTYVLDENGNYKERIFYKADRDLDAWYDGQSDFPTDEIPWKRSIFMPKKAARIFLVVTDVWIERLNEISFQDICKE